MRNSNKVNPCANFNIGIYLLVLHGIEHIGQAALSAILTVEMGSHEDAGTTLFSGALASQTMNFAVVVHTVVLQHGQFNFLMLVFDLLGSGVILLLALLATTTETKDQVKSRLFLDVVIGESSSVLELLSSEDEPLLVWWNAFLILEQQKKINKN